MSLLGIGFVALGLAGAAYSLFSGHQVRRLRKDAGADRAPGRDYPSVTILKPLHGDEAELFTNLESFCRQAYAAPVQIVFGVHDVGDAAVRVVRRVQRAYPQVDIALVIDNELHGENRKVSNLINMERAIRGEVVVLSDSDIAVERHYLHEVVTPLLDPAVGFVTSLYTGRPMGGVWARLSAMGVNYHFLPNVMAGVRLGLANPCLGATIALRRSVLDEVGGFAILANQLADDYDLGRAVRAAGYRGELASSPVTHMCDERDWRELLSHEARWSRTIRVIDPLGFIGAGVTYALPWALLGVTFAPGPYSLAAMASVILARLYVVMSVDRATGARSDALYLLPVRDLVSFVIFVSAFFGRTVMWRGRRYWIDPDGALHPSNEVFHAANPVSPSPVLRRLRWGRGVALPGQARDQVVLVPDLARPARGLGREQQADRRPAA